LLVSNPCRAVLFLLLLRAQLDFIQLIIRSMHELICIMLIPASARLGYGFYATLYAAAACLSPKYPFPDIPLQFPAIFWLATPCFLFFLRQIKRALRRFKLEMRQSTLETSHFKLATRQSRLAMRRFKSATRRFKLEMRQSKLETRRFKSETRHCTPEMRRFKRTLRLEQADFL
jgi:hypothetical protein